MPGYRLIPLRGKNGEGKSVKVSPEDYQELLKINWFVIATRSKDYAACYQNGKSKYMHRLLLGAPKGVEVDHINHDGLDNRRENLRLASRSQNASNTAAVAQGSNKYRGVIKVKASGSFRAAIRHEGKSIVLGSFDNPEDAARMYDGASLLLNKGFATLNFSDSEPLTDEALSEILERNHSSRYVGVYFNKERQHWQAQINRNYHNRYLGRFPTELEAAQAVDDYLESIGEGRRNGT